MSIAVVNVVRMVGSLESRKKKTKEYEIYNSVVVVL